MPRPPLACLLAAALAAFALADGPADNAAKAVRPIPPRGVAVPAATRVALDKKLAAFLVELLAFPKDSPAARYLPDAEIYYKAVRVALDQDQFYTARELAAAPKLLDQGVARLNELKAGRAPWAKSTGLVVRAYRSVIDGSVQPYGLVVPANHDAAKPARLDLWWHGRGEKLSELAFILDRQNNKGEFPRSDAVTLHPYGRYCNANKFAGETDTFEAINHAARDYAIDPSKRVARGFSMGGAACWQFATHFPGYWAAAAPGAGFAETPEFLNNFQNEVVKPTWYEERLWHLTNATDYAANLANLPVVAYSGEVDKQKQAADLMAKAMQAEGLILTHVIGEKAAHKYTPAAKAEIDRRIDAILAKPAASPDEVTFTTFTLSYPRSHWVEVQGLGRHWTRARVHATIANRRLSVITENVTRLRLAPGVGRVAVADLDGQGEFFFTGDLTFEKAGGRWGIVHGPTPAPAKVPGQQGPIDDAFATRFVMVRPTGEPLTPESGAWVKREMEHAVAEWRKQFRGEAVVVDDTAVTPEQKANANLVLWGDARSNKLFAAAKFPLEYGATDFRFGGTTYPAATRVPAMIRPSPFAPGRYVVLNSGVTFREYDLLNNARQVAKLPDYAVFDITTPPTPRAAARVERAGFFGERWELLPGDGK